jgi:hypothetical protein
MSSFSGESKIDMARVALNIPRLGILKSRRSFFQKNQSVGLGKQGWKSLTVAQRSKSGFEPAEKTAQRLQWRNGSA